MRLLKISFLLVFLWLPLMGGDCGGVVKVKCGEQIYASDCVYPECKWRMAKQRKLETGQRCIVHLSPVTPGGSLGAPDADIVKQDKQVCEKEGGTYTEYVGAWFSSNILARCLPNQPCPNMTAGVDSADREGRNSCEEVVSCKYVPAVIIDPGSAVCVDVADKRLDCNEQKTKEKCKSLLLGVDPLCEYKETYVGYASASAQCLVKDSNNACPAVPQTTVSENKADCEKTLGCFYTKSGYSDNAKCEKFACTDLLKNSKSIDESTINSDRIACQAQARYCDYAVPVIELEKGTCTDRFPN